MKITDFEFLARIGILTAAILAKNGAHTTNLGLIPTFSEIFYIVYKWAVGKICGLYLVLLWRSLVPNPNEGHMRPSFR